MRLVPSRYLVLGETTFRHSSGRLLRAVYHTGRARTILLDTVTADALHTTPIPLGETERQRLVDLGLLVPEGTDEAAAVIETGAAAARDHRERQFVIMPTAYCNMGCGYCGQEHRKDNATTGSVRHRAAVTARVTRAMTSGQYDRIRVRWFGGEPLMGFAVLRSLSERFVAESHRTGVPYAALLVTNGALLDGRKLRSLHRDCAVDHIEVTVDGPDGTHETSRPLKSGRRSYDRIVGALRAIIDDPELSTLRATVRTNVGAHNADQAVEFATAMRDAGLRDPRITFYPAPVHAWGNDVSGYALPWADAAEVELRWYAAYLDAGLTCRALPTSTRPVVCTATTRHSEVIAPDGRLFSCTEQPLVPGFTEQHVGDLTDQPTDELRPPGRFDDWYDSLRANDTGCRDCRLLPVCGGACPKLWREGNPPCPPLKHNITQRLDLLVRSSGLQPA